MKNLFTAILTLVCVTVFAQDPIQWFSRNRTLGVGDSLTLTKEAGEPAKIYSFTDGVILRHSTSGGDSMNIGFESFLPYFGVPVYGKVDHYKNDDGTVFYTHAMGEIAPFFGGGSNMPLAWIEDWQSINGIDSISRKFVPALAFFEEGNSGNVGFEYFRGHTSLGYSSLDTTNENYAAFQVGYNNGVFIQSAEDAYATGTVRSVRLKADNENILITNYNGAGSGGNLSLSTGNIYNPFRINVAAILDSNVASGGVTMFDIIHTLNTNNDSLDLYEQGILQTFTVSGGGWTRQVTNEGFTVVADNATIEQTTAWNWGVDTLNGGVVGHAIGFTPNSVMGVEADSIALIYIPNGVLRSNVNHKNYGFKFEDTGIPNWIASHLHLGYRVDHGMYRLTLRADGNGITPYALSSEGDVVMTTNSADTDFPSQYFIMTDTAYANLPIYTLGISDTSSIYGVLDTGGASILFWEAQNDIAGGLSITVNNDSINNNVYFEGNDDGIQFQSKRVAHNNFTGFDITPTAVTISQTSTTGGYATEAKLDGSFVVPVVDTTERALLPTAAGGLIYNSTHGHIEFHDGSRWQSVVSSQVSVYKSYNFSARTASSGTRYLAGFYEAPTTDANLTNAATTVVLGTANVSYAAHAFIVSGGNGSTDGSDLVLTVSGTSITDAGVRTTADSEVIEATATTSPLNSYYETTKKWIGQVTYTLTSTGGSTFSYDFNYGFSKYDDWGNHNFYINDVEFVGLANNTDSGFEIELLRHDENGWTYAATGFEAGNTPLLTLNGVHSTEDDISNGIPFAFKRTDIDEFVNGSALEGFIIRVTTTVNNTVSFMNAHVGVELQ